MSTIDSEGSNNKRSKYHSAFYTANVMEIFERLSWYGFFSVASIYMTNPIAQGGMGFTEQERGTLQSIIPFLLYIFPVFTGALGDRYGYKKMFLLAFAIMTPSYYMLGQVQGFWSFFIVFLSVAVGAAIFKPLVIGTVSRTTDDTNRGLAFGIFYMMVNVGGFAGPLIAGTVRDTLGWDWVFIMAAIWISVNFIPIIFLYKDPSKATAHISSTKRFKDILLDMQIVLGNGRFALIVVPIIVLLMVTGAKQISWWDFAIISAGWVLINLIWNVMVNDDQEAPWYMKKAKIGNGPFVLYILIMSGFWIIYQQIFYTLPLYIQDYVNTANIVHFFHSIWPAFASWVAHINIEQLITAIDTIKTDYVTVHLDNVREVYLTLAKYKVMVPESEIISSFQALAASSNPGASAELANQWAKQYQQINPEYIMSLNFLTIIIFQIVVSLIAEKYRALSILIFGTVLLSSSYLLTSIAHTIAVGGIVVMLGVVTFSFGEMFASPKSQDYVAGIMPKSKAAMFMGYYFVSMALGFLFGGILSGESYDYFAKEINKPEWMWILFAAIGLLATLGLVLFNKFVAPHLEAQKGLEE